VTGDDHRLVYAPRAIRGGDLVRRYASIVGLVLSSSLAAFGGCLPTDVKMALHDECGPDDMSNWPPLDAKPVSPVGQLVPHDETADWEGPSSTIYGKAPEIVAVADTFGIDVLFQDMDLADDVHAKLVRIDRDQERFVVTQIVDVPTLDVVMGLAADDEGFRYVASGATEGHLVTDDFPALGEYREDVVHVDKIDRDGEVVWTVDLDMARGEAFPGAELVINPMVAATSRLVWGGGRLALLHGINTDFDGAVRHQKALTTHLDAATGAITKAASIWVSHSFDQRLIFDGQGFVELHLGDAYPRQIVMARAEPDSAPYPVMHNKGTTGDNNTYSRLGAIALIPPEADPDYGYLVVFSTESTPDITGGEAKNVGLSRIRRDFETTDPNVGGHLDPALPDELISAIDGVDYTNKLQWLTDYTTESGLQAERPKIVALGCDTYVVLWEEWSLLTGEFFGTQGLVIDGKGEVLVEKKLVTEHHIPRGDDAFALDNSAAWISASETGAIHVNRVYADLSYTRDTIE
jgi:hypothetical protein